MGRGGLGATEVGESNELQYKFFLRFASCGISGSEEEGGFFWDHPLFKKYGLLLAKNKNKLALRWIGFCIGPVGCPCFIVEGLVLEAARDTLRLIAHSKEKKRRLQLMATHR